MQTVSVFCKSTITLLIMLLVFVNRRTYAHTVLFALGYEKPYGFLLHAAIDGGSNFCVYAGLAVNKSAQTLSHYFSTAVEKYGRPLLLRTDMCFEAVEIGQDMINNRGPGAFIAGPSTRNQVSLLYSWYVPCALLLILCAH